MTADLKQAAQIALLALEYHTQQTRPITQTEEAIKVLIEALAAAPSPAEGDDLPPLPTAYHELCTPNLLSKPGYSTGQHGYSADQMREYAIAARANVQPKGKATGKLKAVYGDKWEGAEEWMPLAWELCANECGEEACTELIWEGGPIPEPWGDRWLKYEDQAKEMIAMVRASLAAAQAPAPAHADGMLETLVYAAMMHNGKPKTVAEFERAAANVADMLQRRAEVTHNKPVASIYISDDGSREFDDWLVDLPPGNHQLFTAPRPDQPQPESLPHPGAPEAEEMIEKLLAEYNRPSNMKNAARAGYMAAKRLLQNARQPLPAVEDAEPIGWGGVIETCAELCDPHFIAQQDLAELKRYAGNWNSTYRFFPIYAPNTQCAAVAHGPLTDEQAGKLITDATGWQTPLSAHFQIVRAVERAHGVTDQAAKRAPNEWQKRLQVRAEIEGYDHDD